MTFLKKATRTELNVYCVFERNNMKFILFLFVAIFGQNNYQMRSMKKRSFGQLLANSLDYDLAPVAAFYQGIEDELRKERQNRIEKMPK